jgi:hypothetical protein
MKAIKWSREFQVAGVTFAKSRRQDMTDSAIPDVEFEQVLAAEIACLMQSLHL